MKRTISIALVLALALAMAGLAQAATITVGSGSGCDFDTIQAGINAANDADAVLVAPGEYVISEPVTFRGKAITVRSETGRDETTVRMGTPADTDRGSVVVFENNETDASVLDGFTITGGRGSWVPSANASGGGGIFFDASSGTVRNCAIVQNTAENGGGVFAWSGASPTLTNSTISVNSATGVTPQVAGYGGGLCCGMGCLMTLANCTVAENSARMGAGGLWCGFNSSVTMTYCIVKGNLGGGVTCWENASATMTYCTIAENSADVGGGVFGGEKSFITMSHCVIISNTAYTGSGGMETWHQSSADVSNCVIARNTAFGLGGGGVNCSIQGSATIVNSIIWGNTAPKGREIWVRNAGTLSISYSNVAGGQAEATIEGGTINWGTGNIDADPHFADPNNEDYYLKSEAGRWDPNSQTWVQDVVTSPCIDAGDPDSDWRPELWPHGMRANMGAYGGSLQASRSLSDAGNVADLNRDGIVDSADMCIIIDHWYTDEPQYDIAPMPFGDGIVDVKDLVLISEHLTPKEVDPNAVTP